MSTKTTIKRVALVAAVALTLGGFSAVNANAAASALPYYVFTADAGTQASSAAALSSTASGVAGTYNYVEIKAVDDLTGGVLGVSVTGDNGTITVPTQPTTTGANQDTLTVSGNVVTSVNAYVSGSVIRIATPKVGSFTVAVAKNVTTSGVTTTTALQTFSFTVNAASIVGVASAANSTSYIVTDARTLSNVFSNTISADSTTVVAKTTSQVGAIKVTVKDTQATPAALGSATLSASISGSGLIVGHNTDHSGTWGTGARVATAYTDTTTGVAAFAVFGDGTAGTGTISIYAGTTLISTETINFYNTTPASFAVTQALKIGAAGAALGLTANYTNNSGTYETTTAAAVIVAKDAAGNIVGGLGSAGTWSYTSSDATQIAASGAVRFDEDTANALTGAGYYNVTPTFAATATSGSSVTITPKWTSSDLATVVTAAPITFTVGGTTVYGASMAFAASEYNVGDKTTIVITATDKAGNPIADGNYSLFGASFAGLTTSAQITSSVFAYVTGPSLLFVGGKATSGSFYMPVSAGPFNVSGALGATVTSAALQAASTVLTASATVLGGADSALAVDAANAATDAANAAAEEASNATEAASEALAAVNSLATTVASLIAGIKKQLVALTALVKKLQK